jgi:predicted AlkP superfamily pyrophosphatase or phosphodiesterase
MSLHFCFKSAFARVLAVLAIAAFPFQTWSQAFVGRPKLIVIVVIDQFRGDYLNRDRNEFTGRGFNLFMKEGAWFTDCYYDYANTKTAPGHATIGTGAYTDGHGVESNEWWDASRSFDVPVSSVEDERYKLVDIPHDSIPANQPGAPSWAPSFIVGSSPLNLRATTLGDELRLATQGRSRVYGISLKDRAAILPAGQAANAAYWVDNASGQFTTSTYYMEHLPDWARAFNASDRRKQAEKEAMVDETTTDFFDEVGRMPAANSYELDFAKSLITGEKLGQRGVTDLVVISLSANDLQGHQLGPDSDSEEKMILSLDHDLDAFYSWLDQTVGLKNVWLALTADHGIAPMPGDAAKLGINAVAIDMQKVYDRINEELRKRFSKGGHEDFLLPNPDLPYIVLDQRAFKKAGVDEQTAEKAVAELLPELVASLNPAPLPVMHVTPPMPPPVFPASEQRLPPAPRVEYVYTRLQLANGQVPPSEWGRLLEHSYADHGNWFVMVVLDAYQLAGTGPFAGTNHFAPWSYDRHVPLAFYGEPFKRGEYHEAVAPVDLAVTFASLAGVNHPSAAVGRVLTEAIDPNWIKETPSRP